MGRVNSQKINELGYQSFPYVYLYVDCLCNNNAGF